MLTAALNVGTVSLRFQPTCSKGVPSGAAKGKAGVLADVTVTIDLRDEKASHWPFGSPDRRSRFEPHRVAPEDANGKVLEELLQPRSSFKGHAALWSDLQLAYFAGYAMWTYLNIPFLLAGPGVESEEMEPWQESGEAWRRLKVRFQANIATHSTAHTVFRPARMVEETGLHQSERATYILYIAIVRFTDFHSAVTHPQL